LGAPVTQEKGRFGSFLIRRALPLRLAFRSSPARRITWLLEVNRYVLIDPFHYPMVPLDEHFCFKSDEFNHRQAHRRLCGLMDCFQPSQCPGTFNDRRHMAHKGFDIVGFW
jgi:hypothetical protein